ncbi:transcription factor bHLH147 [Neltuma alba]|uniref:transcription factor bHLH147-like n=1 Tax=Neltuma alba TaxID=207710 RepID=UPI0010A59817|nr:transcription factor bHLH147-like [Prosopis alba]XP_028792518.1 transcription factor bHLH147-like [Prosopis alba]
MASSVISNPVTNSDRSRDASKRRRKKKAPAQKNHQEDQIQNHARWKSQAQQQIYTSKLHRALARLNLGDGSSGSGSGDAPRRGKTIREAADRVLAVTANGRTRWSRAILANRLKLKFRNHKRKRVATASRLATGSSRSKKPRVSVFRLKGKTLPAVQRKVRFLGRLVPGCRKQPYPVILEEAIDYISAVQMQIRAMTDLADRLSASSSTSTSAPPG